MMVIVVGHWALKQHTPSTPKDGWNAQKKEI
jgi:hypothetical protein